VAKDSYAAMVLRMEELKPGRATEPSADQFPENVTPNKREHEVSVGDSRGIEVFEGCQDVDVTGMSTCPTGPLRTLDFRAL
jgi:hypothetical protein